MVMQMGKQTKREKYEILRTQLLQERSTFLPHYRDIADYIRPRRIRLNTNDRNRGDKRNTKIYDNTGTTASRTLRSGMMGGITSPARPWFKLTTPDPDLAEFASVKEYLHQAQQRMNAMFLRSNLYNVLPVQYGDLGDFGTGLMAGLEDFTGDVMNFQQFPIGSYMIAKNARGSVDTVVREFEMTVGQLVEYFGKYDEKTGAPKWDNFSTFVQTEYNKSNYQTWVTLCHIVQPNREHDSKMLEAKYRHPFSNCYYEIGSTSTATSNYINGPDKEKYLEEDGFELFPFMAPRWETSGEDVYGTSCPGMDALGDVKQLQLGEKRIFEAVEKMIRPPMVGPTSLRNSGASQLPGDITFVDVREGMQGFRPAHEVRFEIDPMERKQEQCRGRIRKAYYEDLFLMLAETDRSQITAREIDERKEEKLLALGPVLEQLNQDQNDILIGLAYTNMNKQRQLPPPPAELQGVDLRVEYVSIMAQAQKIVGVSSLERFTSYVGNIASYDPSALMKVKADKLIEIYADATSIQPAAIRSDEEVQAMKDQQQKAQAAQQKMDMINQASQSAKNLSQSDTSPDSSNALTDLMARAKAGEVAPSM